MVVQVFVALVAALVGATAGIPFGRWLERRDRLNAYAKGQKVLEAMVEKPTTFVGMTGGRFYFFSAEEIAERSGVIAPDVEEQLLRMEALSRVVKDDAGHWARIS